MSDVAHLDAGPDRLAWAAKVFAARRGWLRGAPFSLYSLAAVSVAEAIDASSRREWWVDQCLHMRALGVPTYFRESAPPWRPIAILSGFESLSVQMGANIRGLGFRLKLIVESAPDWDVTSDRRMILWRAR